MSFANSPGTDQTQFSSILPHDYSCSETYEFIDSLILTKDYDSWIIDTVISDTDLIPRHLTNNNNSSVNLTLPY